MTSKLIVWIVIGAALQAVASAPTTTINNMGICTTQQCVLMAADIIRDMHPDVDPCVDFNEYACSVHIPSFLRSLLVGINAMSRHANLVYCVQAVASLTPTTSLPQKQGSTASSSIS